MDAALNVACAGGEPLALTDCLNFGNPERGEIAWELGAGDRGHRAGGRGARDPGRLGERLALQRDRRPADPADAGRRLRRARPRRDADPVALAPRRPRRAAPRRGRRARRASSGRTRIASRSRTTSRTAGSSSRSQRRPMWSGLARPRPTPPDGQGVIVAVAPRRTLDWPDLDRARDCLMRTCPFQAVSLRGRPFREPTSHPVGVEPTSATERRPVSPSDDSVPVLPQCPGSARTRRTCGRTPDVRRLRHPRPGPRRRAAHLLRPARAPAPRPGVGRDRRLRPRPPHRAARPRPRHAGVRRAEPLRPPRRARDRAHALLDHRLERVGERAAAAPPRHGAHGRARAQRQPDQRRRAARRAARPVRVDLRQRDGRGADRERRARRSTRRSRRRWRSSRARATIVGLADGHCSRSATGTASGRSCSGGSATIPSSPPRRARST